MTEPLGRSQVLEYLLDLSGEYEFHLISFERAQDVDNVPVVQELIRDKKIFWYRLPYSNRLGSLSTVHAIWKAVRKGWTICKKHKIELIHCRSMIPAIMGWLLKKRFGGKLLFDIRGFATDEKVDRKRIKRNSLTFRLLMKMERILYKQSDHVVTLTHKAKSILEETYPHLSGLITVIPTCASKTVFKAIQDSSRLAEIKEKMGYQKEEIILIHTGTVTSWYDFDAELRFVQELVQLDNRFQFLILNRKEQNFINQKVEALGFPKDRIRITSSPFDKMYEYLGAVDYSLFFIRPLFSKQASAPTKFAENVACLLPSITNSGVGDMERWLTSYDVGFLTSLPEVKENPQKVAHQFLAFHEKYKKDEAQFQNLFNSHFDKDEAVKHYSEIYKKIAGATS